MSLLKETLAQGAKELEIPVTEHQLDLFEIYYRLLLEINKKVNLTTILDEKEVAVKHFLDSLTCLKALNFTEPNSLMDIGTGAGFPGVPLKILCPELRVTLVESLDKRVSFLKQIIERLQLEQIAAIHARAEEVGRDDAFREKVDRVTARAVANLSVLAEYCLPVLRPGGYFLAMKGPRMEEEIGGAKKAIHLLGGEIKNFVKLKLPFTGDERNIIVIKKNASTPEKYPRRAGIPQKRPL